MAQVAKRLQLQALLETILGSRNVYFQPPTNIKLKFPCIVYERDNVTSFHADNAPYRAFLRYKVTVIDRDPDSLIPREVAKIPTATFVRFYTADNLNHDVFNIFF